MLLVLHAKYTCDSSIQNFLVVREDTDVIALLSVTVEARNSQLFQKSETQSFQTFSDIKQLRSVLSVFF